jgi:hypothetical protein
MLLGSKTLRGAKPHPTPFREPQGIFPETLTPLLGLCRGRTLAYYMQSLCSILSTRITLKNKGKKERKKKRKKREVCQPPTGTN